MTDTSHTQVGDELLCTGQDDERCVTVNSGEKEVKKQLIRTTVKFLKEKRKRKWTQDFSWVEDDMDRIISSIEALPEELQDYSMPMVIIGGGLVPKLEHPAGCKDCV